MHETYVAMAKISDLRCLDFNGFLCLTKLATIQINGLENFLKDGSRGGNHVPHDNILMIPVT
jgi:hypothetical protein